MRRSARSVGQWFYGILPTIAYLGLAGAASAVWLATRIASYAVGATMLVLLLIGIRNAWDLATSIVQSPANRSEAKKKI